MPIVGFYKLAQGVQSSKSLVHRLCTLNIVQAPSYCGWINIQKYKLEYIITFLIFSEVFCTIQKRTVDVSDPDCNQNSSLGMIQGKGTTNSHHFPLWGCKVIRKELRQMSINSNIVTSFKRNNFHYIFRLDILPTPRPMARVV